MGLVQDNDWSASGVGGGLSSANRTVSLRMPRREPNVTDGRPYSLLLLQPSASGDERQGGGLCAAAQPYYCYYHWKTSYYYYYIVQTTSRIIISHIIIITIALLCCSQFHHGVPIYCTRNVIKRARLVIIKRFPDFQSGAPTSTIKRTQRIMCILLFYDHVVWKVTHTAYVSIPKLKLC